MDGIFRRSLVEMLGQVLVELFSFTLFLIMQRAQ
jgi:hypothetical protein